jgi:hypothetical protein
VAAGTPLCDFVEANDRPRPSSVSCSAASVSSLPLAKQNKFLLLRSLLRARLTHLSRITPWQEPSPHVAAVKRQVLLATFHLLQHPPPAGLTFDSAVTQISLSHRSRGFGL